MEKRPEKNCLRPRKDPKEAGAEPKRAAEHAWLAPGVAESGRPNWVPIYLCVCMSPLR